MKKIFFTFIFIILLIVTIFTAVLSTIGLETNKFNNIIIDRITENNLDTVVELETVKFKLDFKELSLFLETINPKIKYKRISIPVKKVKVYFDFVSLIKNSSQIKKINASLHELKISEVKELFVLVKPSNFKSIVNNKINKGKINSEIEIYLDKGNTFKNFIAKGNVNNFNLNIYKDFNFENGAFNFFADKSDILITNIFGNFEGVAISNGDLKLDLHSGISINSNFYTELKMKKNLMNNYLKIFKFDNFINQPYDLQAQLNNNFYLSLDSTYKIKDFNFNSEGKIKNLKIQFHNSIENNFLKKPIDKVFIKDAEFKTQHNLKTNSTNISGKYSFYENELLKFDFKNETNFKGKSKLDLNLDFQNELNFEIINYQKIEGKKAKISLTLEKKRNEIFLKNFSLKEGNSVIKLEDLKIVKNEISSFKKISVKTFKNKIYNNEFIILNDNKILIDGKTFDGSNLPKILSRKNKKNELKNLNKLVEINLSKIIAPLSENLENFRLIGKMEKGKFIKITSKGEFGNNNFLDISMKDNREKKLKYLEIYSDLPRPLLSQYSFFNGLTGGKLNYISSFNDKESNSKLVIEKFKVIDAPGVIQLLSLADLGGLVDLAEGEGLSFDILEIKMNSKNGLTEFEEIYAVGPSISVLMEGYQDQNNHTSLRGTLIPAKNLNKLISKIPVIGDIIIPKEVGEGLFGISFKIKGKSGKMKTTINPIRTITPRFLQKILDKNKLNNFN